jgi:serine/threonine-protein kinase
MVRHATETPRPLSEFNRDIPDGLQQVVNWMMAKQPTQRYPTPERAAQALQIFLMAESTAPSSAGPVEAPQLRKFLTWLETDGNGEAASRVTPASSTAIVPPVNPAPVAAPAPRRGKLTPVPPTRSAKASVAGDKKVRRERERSAVAAPVAQPVQPPVAAPAAGPVDIDVELVPHSSEEKKSLLRLSRRDWVLLASGAGAVIFFGVLGMIVAWLLR